MTAKVLITGLTWRTEKQERESILKIYPDFGESDTYRGIEGRNMLVRPTRRKEQTIVYAASLACLSADEDDLIDFLRKARVRDLRIICAEESFEWYPQRSLSIVLRAWKLARNNGSAKIGGQISAQKREAIAKQKAETIRPFWHLPNAAHKTYVLLRQAGICRATAEKHLGVRRDVQRNYQAAQKRKARRQEAGRV